MQTTPFRFFFENGSWQKFGWQTCHITCFFTNLIYRKIKNDNFWKICLRLCSKRPVNGQYEIQYRVGRRYESKYRLLIDVLTINAFFDFDQYNLLEDIGKSKMITDVFEKELINAFNQYGVGAEGIATLKNAVKEIRKNNYIYKGVCKQYLLSPNKTYKVIFEFVWKLREIELYVRVRKPYAKRDICHAFLAAIRSDWFTIRSYIESIVWTSENEFVARMYDLSGRMKVFNISERSVKDYEKGDPKTY